MHNSKLTESDGKVRVWLDFNGTLTGYSGSEVIRSDSYKQLFVDTTAADYMSWALKPSAEIQSNLKRLESKGECDVLRLLPEAVSFLISIADDPRFSVTIVTRLSARYVKAILTFENIPSSNIERITIRSTYEGKAKDELVAWQYTDDTVSVNDVHAIFDDNKGDAHRMYEGVTRCFCDPGETPENVVKLNVRPGNYDWRNEFQDLVTFLETRKHPKIKEIQAGGKMVYHDDVRVEKAGGQMIYQGNGAVDFWSSINAAVTNSLTREPNGSDLMSEVTSEGVVRLWLDFDGTLTKTPGAEVVEDPLYQERFFETWDGYYATSMFKSEQDVQAALRDLEKEGLYEKFRLQNNALAFLVSAADPGSGFSVTIVTRNRAEYVKGILTFEGMPRWAMERIIIRDITENLEKHIQVERQCVQDRVSENDIHVIADDDPNAADRMSFGLTRYYRECGMVRANTVKLNVKTGEEYLWGDELNHLQTFRETGEHPKIKVLPFGRMEYLDEKTDYGADYGSEYDDGCALLDDEFDPEEWNLIKNGGYFSTASIRGDSPVSGKKGYAILENEQNDEDKTENNFGLK